MSTTRSEAISRLQADELAIEGRDDFEDPRCACLRRNVDAGGILGRLRRGAACAPAVAGSKLWLRVRDFECRRTRHPERDVLLGHRS
jgi:hypothetical protein